MILTRGSAPLKYCRRGGDVHEYRAFSVAGRDTTGAGDSFDAGFVYGYTRGWPLDRTLRLACACGALATRVPGGTNGQPTLAEAWAALGETNETWGAAE